MMGVSARYQMTLETCMHSLVPLALLGLTLCGCTSETPDQTDAGRAAPPILVVEDDPDAEPGIDTLMQRLKAGERGTAQKVGGKIRAVALANTPVTDLEPLRGLQLISLDLQNTRVVDLVPLAGMPLEELFAEHTRIVDLSPLAGMPLKKLYLEGTGVTDLTPLAGMTFDELNLNATAVESLAGLEHCTLGTLWIPKTRVRDLTPLAGKRIVSLDLAETPVDSLAPLEGMSTLRRLNIADSAVTDLSPLKNLQLERLVLTLSKIEAGLDAIRGMPSLQSLGPNLDELLPAAEFWKQYDAAKP